MDCCTELSSGIVKLTEIQLADPQQVGAKRGPDATYCSAIQKSRANLTVPALTTCATAVPECTRER